MLCGSSCVKYILNSYKKDCNNLNNYMNWISELAISLKNNDFKVILECFKSNLYNDYKLTNDYSFEGFKYLKMAIDRDIPIKEIKLTKKELINEIKNNDFIILNVESSIFNNDKSMSGGHFIILNKINNDLVSIINPIKDKYEFKEETIDNIIKYCKNYGSWRLLIKEK